MIRKILFALIAILVPLLGVAETLTFVCTYKTFSDNEGTHKVKGEFELTFILDVESGNAYMVGNNGSAEVQVVAISEALSFIEITPVGNVMTTTVTPTLRSVHSRNSVLFGDLVPSQYYGKCVTK